MRIRELDRTRDLDFLRRCVIELQEIERGFDPRLPAGAEMVDRYCTRLLERCGSWRGTVFIAEREGQPVGLLSMFLEVPETEPDEPPGSHALVSDLYVLPGARGTGVGSALLRRAEEHARDEGAGVLRMEVMAANAAARRLYARHGWIDRVVQMEKQQEGSGGGTLRVEDHQGGEGSR